MLRTLSLVLLVLTLVSCKQMQKNKSPEDEAHESEYPATESLSQPVSDAGSEEELRQASLEGRLTEVRSLLAGGTDPNAMDADGRTALMFAAFNGNSEIVLALLEKDAIVDRRDLLGRTALMFASTGPFPETVSILLDRGAEVNVVDSDEHFSPLMHAAAEGHLDVVKTLMKAGADPSLKDVDGDDAAGFARQNGHDAVAAYLNSL